MATIFLLVPAAEEAQRAAEQQFRGAAAAAEATAAAVAAATQAKARATALAQAAYAAEEEAAAAAAAVAATQGAVRAEVAGLLNTRLLGGDAAAES